MSSVFTSLGTPGQPWGVAEKQAWVQAQTIQRSYASLVVERVQALSNKGFEVHQYGKLSYSEQYPVFVVKSLQWNDKKPTVLVTGGGKMIQSLCPSSIFSCVIFFYKCCD